MVQVIGLLLCVYLIFKGIEIFQIAWVTDRKWYEGPIVLGVLCVVAAVAIALFFAYWLLTAGEMINNRLPPR